MCKKICISYFLGDIYLECYKALNIEKLSIGNLCKVEQQRSYKIERVQVFITLVFP